MRAYGGLRPADVGFALARAGLFDEPCEVEHEGSLLRLAVTRLRGAISGGHVRPAQWLFRRYKDALPACWRAELTWMAISRHMHIDMGCDNAALVLAAAAALIEPPRSCGACLSFPRRGFARDSG